jgi:site-specific DNA-cytosine methylase
MSEHFPQYTMAADFASVMAAGDGEGTFLGAAKSARVAFASPPCSQTSVVNKQRDESSYAARLCIYMLQVLAVAPMKVLVFESTPAIMSALGGRLMAEMYAAMAALPIPYVPQILHVDPLRLGSSQGRTRVLTIMVRRDVFERKGAFMPPLSYQVSATPPSPLRSLLDVHEASPECEGASDDGWVPTGTVHRDGYIGSRLGYTREEDGKTLRCYGSWPDGLCVS